MQIGRNFTNMLETSFLSEKERKELKQGGLSVGDMDARVQIKAKKDIVNQLKVGKEIGLSHVELDGGVPNPFLEMEQKELDKTKKFAEDNRMSISLHLPYTYVGASTCAFQESDRSMAVELQKKYIDFASKIKAKSVVMHPGTVPFYQATGEYMKMVDCALEKTVVELAAYASKRDIVFHLENNTAFDSVGVYNFQLIEKISRLRKQGVEVKYCFDIGHWFTIALPMHKNKFSSESIPETPEDIIDEIPSDLLHQVHLNDFWINPDPRGAHKDKPPFKFHPPLHYQQGFLKEENLKNIAEKFREKGVRAVIVETAVRDTDELLNARKVLENETAYLNRVMGI